MRQGHRSPVLHPIHSERTMSSIGPQIPPHLLQRSSRETKDDFEDTEPHLQGSSSRAQVVDTPSIGPQIPQTILSQARQSSQPEPDRDEDDDDDDYVPELPPDLAALRSGGPSRPEAGPSTTGQAKRVLGPSLPGHDRQNDSENDEDEDYGPMPSMQGAQRTDALSEGVREFMEKEEKRKKEIEVCLQTQTSL